MRILFVLGGLRIGGYEVLTVKIANELHRRGNKVIIVSLHTDNQIVNRVEPGIDIRFITRRFRIDISFIYRISWVLKTFRPDIVFSCAYFEYLIVRFASFFMFRRPKFVLAFHQTKPYDRKEEEHFRIGSFFARLFNDRYVAIHRSQIDFYSVRYRLPKKRFTLIYNGVDTRHFSPDARVERQNGDVFRIAHVATLKPLKDQWTLLKSMVELNKDYKDWELTIAGQDQTGVLAQYKDFVVKHNLSDKTKFVGSILDARSVLRGADVFVLTSVTEALPLAVIEAIAMGIPCIVTDVGGNPNIIEDGREGFLVQPRDYRTIAEHIRYLIKKPDVWKEMSLAARRKAVKNFDFDHMIDSYCVLFNRILDR